MKPNELLNTSQFAGRAETYAARRHDNPANPCWNVVRTSDNRVVVYGLTSETEDDAIRTAAFLNGEAAR